MSANFSLAMLFSWNFIFFAAGFIVTFISLWSNSISPDGEAVRMLINLSQKIVVLPSSITSTGI